MKGRNAKQHPLSKTIKKQTEILITCLCRYLKKKSNKNDFPLRKAPATETTTTLLSRIES